MSFGKSKLVLITWLSVERSRKCHGQTIVNEGDLTMILGLSRRGVRTDKVKRFWVFVTRPSG